MLSIIAILISYLIGSISSAIIICKLCGLPDPRTEGSRNPGATNVLRIGGKKAAVATLFGDLLKGLLPVLFAQYLQFDAQTIACIAFAAFLGHLFPIYFRFAGGKGVATSLGCIIGLSLPAGAFWIGTWLLMAVIFRYSSLAALVAMLVAPLDVWIFNHSATDTAVVLLMSIILICRHHTNIKKLLAGTEQKIYPGR